MYIPVALNNLNPGLPGFNSEFVFFNKAIIIWWGKKSEF